MRPSNSDELNFRLLFASLSGFYLVLKADSPRYSIVAVSGTCAQLSLMPHVELTGRGLFDVFPGDSAAPVADEIGQLRASLARVIEKRAIDVMEVQRSAVCAPSGMGGADGGRWWSQTNSPVFGPDGEISHIVHRIEDVTALVQMGTKLAAPSSRASRIERSLCDIVRLAPVSMALLDRSLNYLAVSGPWKRDYGQGQESPVGRNHCQVLSDIPERWKQRYQQALAGTAQESEEDLWVRADGRKQWLRWSAVPWYDELGALGGILISSVDVTQHQHDVAQLQESEQRYAAIFEKSPFAISLSRMPGLELVSINEAFLQLFEYTRDELVGKSSIDLKIADAASRARAEAEFAAHGSLRDFECVRTMKSGSRRVLSLTLQPVRISDRDHILTTIRDITQQRAAEENARLYEKAKLLNEVKTQFFAGVSHELRTPLALILGPIERLLADPELAEPARRTLELIDRNARTLLHYVNELLDVVKLDAGAMRVEYAETDVSRLTRCIASHFESLADEKQLAYRLDIPEGIRAQLDSEKVKRILLNLLSNAFKFTPSRGQVQLSLRASDGQIHFEVADSGPGIPPAQRALLFERFRQLEEGPSSRFGGTGLGLAIARDFVELHGGSIAIADAPEGGARFLVSLPQQAPHGAQVRRAPAQGTGADAAPEVLSQLHCHPASSVAQSGDAKAALILVVEDNQDLNQFICESLSAEYRVASAHNGQEGLRRAIAIKPDVIVTDMMMPEMGGEELARAVRAHPELEHTPIMFLTAKSDDALRVRSLREGAQDFLIKPFALEELRARVSNLVSGKRALELEARLAALIEQAPDGIFVSDETGHYVEVNEAACQMLGYSRDELIGASNLKIVSPADRHRVVEARERVRGGGVDVSEWLLRKKDGTDLPVEVSAKFLRDGRWQSFVRDISERKRLEQALRLAEAKASGIISIATDAIIATDEEQHITLFNEGAEKIFGYKKNEVLGNSLALLLPERFRAAHAHQVQRFSASQESLRSMGQRGAAMFGRRKSGEEFPADAAISQFEVAGQKQLTVILRDITEQQRYERTQRILAEVGPVLTTNLEYNETLSRLARFLAQELADLCIIDVIEESGEARRVEVACRDPLLGKACETLKKVQFERLELTGAILESKRSVLMPELTPEQIAEFTRGDVQLQAMRSFTPTALLAVPMLARGKVMGVLSMFTSSAAHAYGPDEVQLIEEIAQRAALSLENARLYRVAGQAIQARDDVLGIVAHDLRNPLNAIVLQLQLLKRIPEQTSRMQESAERIRKSVQRMNRLIQDLLDITRIEAGALSIELSPIPAAQLLTEAVESQQSLAASSSIELRLDVVKALPPVLGDRGRLLQVFENLIGNAVKFSPAGSYITLGAEERSRDVLFWVRDTGAGIPAEHLPHLFDRFWQARQADRLGVGLGLPIVRGVVSSHGGRIWVDSIPGQGSTFYFTIPTAHR